MLEFLWSASSKPPPSEGRLAQEGNASPAEDTPRADGSAPAPTSAPSEGGAAAMPATAPPPVLESADGCALPSAFASARRSGRRRGRRLVKPAEPTAPLTAELRLLLLDTWRRSGLPAGDFAALIGMSKYTLYAWKKKFEQQGPAGLLDRPRGGPTGSKLPDLTRRSILMIKEANPSWGCQRISDMLARGPALPASAGAVARVLHEAGYELEEVATRPHPDKVRRFERATPNQLWQTDLFIGTRGTRDIQGCF